MQSAWLSALSFLVVSTLVGVGMLGAARDLRVRARRSRRSSTAPTSAARSREAMAWMQFHARYYVVALFFVLFDVEAVFLFPWAVVLRELGRARVRRRRDLRPRADARLALRAA